MFVEVFNPGGVGFGPYRTEFQEIEAYARMTRRTITPSEALLIRDLAELYMIVTEKKPGQPELRNQTSMSDNEGLKRLFLSKGGEPPKAKKIQPK